MTTDEQFDAIVANHLAAIEERLLEATVSSDPFVTEAAAHVVAAGGKRFRPALVVLCALCGERPDEEALTHAALVVELTHVASLYHDDVMDEADIRRGVTSANLRYGNTIAILVGDFLFARASGQVASLGVDFVDLQARTFADLVEGQIAETTGPAPGDDPLEHHLSVIAGKTASLIGMVFQLSDDLIDVVSDTTGKPPGTDLREGVPTLPTLLLRKSDNPADQELVRLIDAGLTDDADLARALAGLRASHAIEQTGAEILRRAEGARAQLAPLPESAAKRALGRLCDLVVTRSS